MLAVVKIGSSQYLVTPGQELLVDRQNQKDTRITFDQVYLVSDADRTEIGKPTVANAKVEAEVIGPVKGTKIRIATFKAKSRFRKVRGFRPHYTKIRISEIKF